MNINTNKHTCVWSSTHTHTSKQKIRSLQWSWWKWKQQQQHKHRTTTTIARHREERENQNTMKRNLRYFIFRRLRTRWTRVERVSSQIYLWTEWNDLYSLVHSYACIHLVACLFTHSLACSLKMRRKKISVQPFTRQISWLLLWAAKRENEIDRIFLCHKIKLRQRFQRIESDTREIFASEIDKRDTLKLSKRNRWTGGEMGSEFLQRKYNKLTKNIWTLIVQLVWTVIKCGCNVASICMCAKGDEMCAVSESIYLNEQYIQSSPKTKKVSRLLRICIFFIGLNVEHSTNCRWFLH